MLRLNSFSEYGPLSNLILTDRWLSNMLQNGAVKSLRTTTEEISIECGIRSYKLGILFLSMTIDKSSSGKLSARWLGPFRIRQISPRTSSYLLETLAGIPIERMVAGDRLKKFVVNEDGYLDDISEMEVRPDLEQALNKVFPAANQPDPDAPSLADILDPDELSALEEAETDDFNAMKA
ncbi:rve domain containing protein [Colletotrichum asianum]